jgi:hypothetical protein
MKVGPSESVYKVQASNPRMRLCSKGMVVSDTEKASQEVSGVGQEDE